MKYVKSEKYSGAELMGKIMGPNPVKLTEELLSKNKIKKDSVVLDLGSGTGLTSVFINKEYGFTVYAADLWSDPEENKLFFESMGIKENAVIPVKADALQLPFEKEFFDAVISTDSYNYFGRDEKYLDEKLLPFLKKDGLIYLAITGMKKDLHNSLPQELLLSWTCEQLDYIHDIAYWRKIFEKSKNAELLEIKEMESNVEVWEDWIKQENEYAVSDRKSVEAGALKYLNFISAVLRKK